MKYIVWIVVILLLVTQPAYSKNSYRILINIPSRTLEVIDGSKVVKSYPVGVGRRNFPTPIGNFRIISKVVNPAWENPYLRLGRVVVKPGRRNPLGTRWMGFHRVGTSEYGMHGTNNPSSVGKLCSHGCIRMKIKDAEDLFSRIKIGTPVKIAYYCNKVTIKNHKISIKRYPNVYRRKLNLKKDLTDQLKYLELPSSFVKDKKYSDDLITGVLSI